jgi:hypothetical protein
MSAAEASSATRVSSDNKCPGANSSRSRKIGRSAFGMRPLAVSRPTRSSPRWNSSSLACSHVAQRTSAWEYERNAWYLRSIVSGSAAFRKIRSGCPASDYPPSEHVATYGKVPRLINRSSWVPQHARPCTVDDIEFHSIKPIQHLCNVTCRPLTLWPSDRYGQRWAGRSDFLFGRVRWHFSGTSIAVCHPAFANDIAIPWPEAAVVSQS